MAQTDAMVAELLGGLTLPMTSDLQHRGGVPTYVVTPESAPLGDDSPVFLSIHGWALVMGGGDLTRVMTEISALSAPVVHWAPDYRMPPAYPYPAALDEVYRALLAVRDPAQIVVGGGSAGGNLAAALLLRAKAEAPVRRRDRIPAHAADLRHP